MKEPFYIAAGSPGTFSRYLSSRGAGPGRRGVTWGCGPPFWNDLAAPLTRGVKDAGPPGGERPVWAHHGPSQLAPGGEQACVAASVSSSPRLPFSISPF